MENCASVIKPDNFIVQFITNILYRFSAISLNNCAICFFNTQLEPAENLQSDLLHELQSPHVDDRTRAYLLRMRKSITVRVLQHLCGCTNVSWYAIERLPLDEYMLLDQDVFAPQ